MKRKKLFWLIPLVLLGCTPGPKSPQGFRLPDGDAQAGQAAFEQLGCVACHSVEGVTFASNEEKGAIDVLLGGKFLRVRTYGELVTAIVHPSESLAKGYPPEVVAPDGESLMSNFNETMTVRQLIDIVAFLQPTYVEYLPKDYDPFFP